MARGAHRILIIDLDAHCGGGTAELIEPLGSNVHHLDIATCTYDAYEFEGGVIIVNAAAYLTVLMEELADLPTDFDLCLYNAGMDPYEGCAEGGACGMSKDILATREQMVFQWCRQHRIPVAFVLAGGYVGKDLDQATLVDLHRLTIEAAVSTN